MLKKLIYFSKYLLKAKWTIRLPKKNKYVLVDGNYNPFIKYIKKKISLFFTEEEKKSILIFYLNVC